MLSLTGAACGASRADSFCDAMRDDDDENEIVSGLLRCSSSSHEEARAS